MAKGLYMYIYVDIACIMKDAQSGWLAAVSRSTAQNRVLQSGRYFQALCSLVDNTAGGAFFGHAYTEYDVRRTLCMYYSV